MNHIKTQELEFCPKCGHQMFAKDDEQAESVNSRFEIILLCGACKHECTLQDTFTLARTYINLPNIRSQYIKFPVDYDIQKGRK